MPRHEAAKLPPNNEWDLSDCTKREKYHCFCYEFGRECPAIVEQYRRDKITGQNVDQKGYWQFLWPIYHEPRVAPWLLMQTGSLLLYFPPGFPETPFLDTKHEDLAFPPLVKPLLAAMPIIQSAVRLEDGSYEVNGTKVSSEEIYSIYLNPTCSYKALVTAFPVWLQTQRRRKPRQKTDIRRGRSSLSVLITKYLKALTVYRLLRTLTAEQAISALQELVDQRKLDRLPYQHPSDWSEKKTLASKLIKVINGQILETGDHDQRDFSRLLFELPPQTDDVKETGAFNWQPDAYWSTIVDLFQPPPSSSDE